MKTYICLTFCAIVTRVTRYADTSIPLTAKTSSADCIAGAWLLHASVLYKESENGQVKAMSTQTTRRRGESNEVH